MIKLEIEKYIDMNVFIYHAFMLEFWVVAPLTKTKVWPMFTILNILNRIYKREYTLLF